MQLEINIDYLRTMFLQIIEGIFADEQPDLGNYLDAIQEFAEMLNTEEAYFEFRDGLKSAMQYAILHPENLELNKLFCEATGDYLQDDMRVHELIQLAWREIYSSETPTSPQQHFQNARIVDTPVQF
jgi:hypothetical protein